MTAPATMYRDGTPTVCSDCAGPVDKLRRCWRCCDRPCVDCGRPTGTVFVEVCLLCEYRRQSDGEERLPSFTPSSDCGIINT